MADRKSDAYAAALEASISDGIATNFRNDLVEFKQVFRSGEVL